MHSAQTNLPSYHFAKLTTADIPKLSNFSALLPLMPAFSIMKKQQGYMVMISKVVHKRGLYKISAFTVSLILVLRTHRYNVYSAFFRPQSCTWIWISSLSSCRSPTSCPALGSVTLSTTFSPVRPLVFPVTLMPKLCSD